MTERINIMKPCKACKHYFALSRWCKKFMVLSSENEKHNACFEPKKPIKNPLEGLKEKHNA